MRDVFKVYVSSTCNDLQAHRLSVYNALRKNRKCDVIWMEDYVAVDQRPLDKCLADVANCDIYVGIFAWRYGYIPNEDNPDRLSITELEYRHAKRRKKPRLVFLLDENASWPDSLRDEHTGEGSGGRCIAELRKRLREDRVVSFFETCDRLALEVFSAVSKLIDELPPVTNDPRSRRDELTLLNKVKQNWVEGKLKGSLYHEVLIPLNGVTRREGVEGWDAEFERPDQDFRVLLDGQGIGRIFDSVSHSLLILGEPGSGKTITLLELTRNLVARAELDPYEPIPVVFNLSSWTNKPQILVDWLSGELRSKYQIPEKIGRHWLENQRIVPLLDGLDEVKPDARDGCAKAISEFTQEACLTGLAVCSRVAEFERLPLRPKLSGAIRLLPLTPAQIDTYLQSAGLRLSALHHALETDEGLRWLAQSPLMLSVMSFAYEDMSREQLTGTAAGTLDRRQHLFDSYIDRMFKRKSNSAQPYTKKQTIDWLSRSAQKMIQHSQSTLLLEELQPSWLPRKQFWLYNCTCRLISGLVLGLVAGLIRLGFEGRLSFRTLYFLLYPGAFGAVIVPPLLLVKSFVDEQRLLGVPLRAMVKPFRAFAAKERIWKVTKPIPIRTSEQFVWKWRDIKKAGFTGLKAGTIGTLVVGMIAETAGFIQGELPLLEAGYHYVADIIVFGILFMGLGGLLGGLSSGILEGKIKPNQGVSLSLRNACVMAICSAMIIGLLIFIYLVKPLVPARSYVFGEDTKLLARLGKYGYAFFGACLTGMFYGQVMGMVYGGYCVIMHWVLRFFLYCNGTIPLRYARLLDCASDRIFLRRVGGTYEFIHGLLLEHFALKSSNR